jgi:hypothetical protein
MPVSGSELAARHFKSVAGDWLEMTGAQLCAPTLHFFTSSLSTQYFALSTSSGK